MASVTIFGHFLNEALVMETLHNHVYELGDVLATIVRDKTPVLTGSLQSSIFPYLHHDYVDPILVEVYSEQSYQVAQWGRTYVQYVEGPPLGTRTWTNPPRHIFLGTSESDGVAATIVWAVLHLRAAQIVGAPI